MKKAALSFLLIFVFGAYVLHQKFDVEEDAVVVPPKTVTSTNNTNAPKTTPLASPSPLSTNSGQYKDGEYTGDVADAYYGNVQVKATITNGRISDVVFLQYPSDRRTSQIINGQAMPYLKTEAIQAQSSKVDIISGATQTSYAFIQSLGSALALAKK